MSVAKVVAVVVLPLGETICFLSLCSSLTLEKFVVELGDKDFPAPKIKREGIRDVGPQLGAFFKSSKDLTHNLYFFK